MSIENKLISQAKIVKQYLLTRKIPQSDEWKIIHSVDCIPRVLGLTLSKNPELTLIVFYFSTINKIQIMRCEESNTATELAEIRVNLNTMSVEYPQKNDPSVKRSQLNPPLAYDILKFFVTDISQENDQYLSEQNASVIISENEEHRLTPTIIGGGA